MKNLSKTKKLIILKEAYNHFLLNSRREFICTSIRTAIWNLYYEYTSIKDIQNILFPELLSFRPSNNFIVWWPVGKKGFKDRDKVFKELIKTYEDGLD